MTLLEKINYILIKIIIQVMDDTGKIKLYEQSNIIHYENIFVM